MRTHAIASLAALLTLAACSPDFDGPEKVKGLRVLAVRADPPELGAVKDAGAAGWPQADTTLESLIGHPGFAAGDETVRAVVLHLACTPTPGDPLGTACTQISELSQPSDLLKQVLLDPAVACSGAGQGTEGAITFSGLEACSRSGCDQLLVPPDPADPATLAPLPTPRYRLPDDFSLGGLAAGNTQRVLGTDVVDLAVTLEAAPADLAPATAVSWSDSDCGPLLDAVLTQFLARWQDRAHIISLKWIHVRGPDMPADSKPNLNPLVSGISLGGSVLPLLTEGKAPQAVDSGKTQDLLPVLPGDCRLGGSAPPTCFDGLRQQYQRFDTDGHYLDTKEEDWAYSWFGTAGDFDEPHTTSWDEKNTYKLKSGRAMIWLVVRDLRGGEAWTAAEVQVP